MTTAASKTPDTSHAENQQHQDRLAHLVKNAWRAMVRALQIRLIEHNVSFGHWSFLRILWEKDGLTQRELADRSGMTTPTTFTAINAMETLGYVRRKQMNGNKKNVYIFLTPRGRKLEDKLQPLAEEINAAAVEGLNEEDIQAARLVLEQIAGNLVTYEQKLMQSENLRVPSTRQLGKLYTS
ncbi:MarR family transcriptional regulator [Pusillimonas sp. CC-YST705]|uniref:MarR family transcriptional regulator n=1 Tax=Mesopusillimonas faecipullorum TaxID=2755040 RepID=A0ABS8CFN7_9BURK|nr:MarR family transcriptional regulator [Mesopusillimonas faecipullorum]MCB5364861.1 MarR family transcriptional regulator [Mesopusillimonas faecipullorum]